MTYDELKTQWTNYMHRGDLDAQYDFTAALILSRLARDLRSPFNETEQGITTTEVPSFLPDDFREMREVTTIFQGLSRALTYLSPVQFNNYAYRGGVPTVYTLKNNKLLTKGFGDVTINYWRAPIDLVIAGTTDTLTAYPDLYLYAGLAELNRFVQDDALSQQFTGYYKNELMLANTAAQAQATGNRPVLRAS